MKISELHLCYNAFINLYGVIFSDYIYEILKAYGKDITKKELSEDLKKFQQAENSQYRIYDASIKNKYVLIRNDIKDEEIEIILYQLTRKPMYIPSSFEEFMKYTNRYYYLEEINDINKRLILLFTANNGGEPIGQSIPFSLKQYIDTLHYDLTDLLEFFKSYNIEFKGPKMLISFVQLYQELLCKTRLAYNCGYTACELASKLDKEQAKEMDLFLTPNIKQMLLNNKFNKAVYFVSAAKCNIPLLMKDLVLSEISEFNKEVKSVEA